MSATADDTQVLEKLRALGAAELEHLNGPLFTHLQGTAALLRAWGARAALCDAGLYHAVYGTVAFDNPLIGLPDRHEVAVLIGAEAEQLVYCFGACDRDHIYPQIARQDPVIFRNRFTGETSDLATPVLRDLAEMVLANELEIAIADPEFREQNRSWFVELFDRFEGIVSHAGFRAYTEVFGATR